MNDLISRQEAIRWVKTECNPYGKPTLDFESGKKVIEHLEQMPSSHPEQKNQKTALSVQVKVDFDDMKALLEDIGNLQTYKLSEGDDMVLADIEDIECILAKHVKAKEVQPERKKGRWIFPYETTTMVSICSECGAHGKGNYCPNCGADMRGE